MTRLMECLEAKEGVEAQYAGVYILKWRSEWGPPEYLFREVDDSVVDDLLAACKAALEWFSYDEKFDIDSDFCEAEALEVQHNIRAAIEKATGEIL